MNVSLHSREKQWDAMLSGYGEQTYRVTPAGKFCKIYSKCAVSGRDLTWDAATQKMQTADVNSAGETTLRDAHSSQ